MTVLVTGGMGVIGSWCTRELVERGIRTVTYDKVVDTTFLEDIVGRFESVVGDILDLPHLIRSMTRCNVERVVHLAGLATPPLEKNPYHGYRVNVDGSLNVFEAARLTGVKRVVAMSSRSVYDIPRGEYGHPGYRPVKEDYPRVPRSVYGATKLFMEHMGLAYRRIHGLDFLALRCANTYGPGKLTRRAVGGGSGPGSHDMYSRMVEYAFAGRSLSIPRGGDQVDDIVYTRDIARGAVLACLAENPEDPIFNIGTGRGETPRRLLETLTAILGDLPIELGPGTGFAGQTASILNIESARRQLGFEPAFDLKAGVEDYIRVLKSNKTGEWK